MTIDQLEEVSLNIAYETQRFGENTGRVPFYLSPRDYVNTVVNVVEYFQKMKPVYHTQVTFNPASVRFELLNGINILLLLDTKYATTEPIFSKEDFQKMLTNPTLMGWPSEDLDKSKQEYSIRG